MEVPTGLTSPEVKERVDRGEVNVVSQSVSRTYADIIRTNVLNWFNLVLFGLGGVLIALGEPMQAAAASGIVVFNVLVGTTQEVKAKRRLDKIALLYRPRAFVVRDGTESELFPQEIVKDDIIRLGPGEQALVDGELLAAESLEIDESLLTGESSTVKKRVGDPIYSGSFCVTGRGYFRVTAFGEESYASKMLEGAKKFNVKKTPLQKETEDMIKVLMTVAGFYFLLLIILALAIGIPLLEFTLISVIILDIVPIALFLLIVIAYALGAVRMAGSGALVQRSNAVESMSHVDTVCMDKTGTITTNRMVFEDLIRYGSNAEMDLRYFATVTGSKNKTIEAILDKYPEASCELMEEIQFSSERKYSAVRIRTESQTKVLYLGAYDVLSKFLVDDLDLKARVKKKAAMGLRVLLLAEMKDGPLFENDKPRPPKDLKAVALVTVRDEVRPDCRETIEVFIKNDMDIKIISGDDPQTVKALATQAAIPGSMSVLSGPELDALKGQELVDAVLNTNIFGRMRPQQKEDVIDILQKEGRYVAMVGDGVNDVHSLKKANMGVALESGSGAARAVADIVLIKDNFAALPQALVEGRRVVNGMKNVLRLYLARNFTLIFLLLLVFLFFGSIPLLPTNGAYYAFLSVSIVAFLMTLWSRPQRITESILPRVVHFALPAAMLIAFFGFIVYSVYQLSILNGLMDIPFTTQQLDEFGYFLTYEGSAEPSLVQRSAEMAARNAMLNFVTLAGISLIFLAAPYYRFLSVDGELYDDIKPTLLAFLLYFLVWLVFQWDVAMYVAGVVPLRLVDFFFISGMVVIWLLVTLNVLRNRWLDGFTRWAMQKMGLKDGQRI